jgi:hypothetical protein
MILICVIGGYLFNLGITSNYWILTILIPLPIVTIIFSILSRKNNMKNIGKHSMFMAGIASMVILIATLMLILFSKYEKRDYGLVTRIENEIAFVLPDEGTIFTTDFSTRKDAKYKTLSKIKFANNYEISSFEESIENSSKWISNLSSELLTMIPLYLQKRATHYLLYNVNNDEFNTKSDLGTFDFILIYYYGEGDMSIVEYRLDIK